MTASATVYLDNNATTAPAPQVVAAMIGCLQSDWGNPSSLHRIGAAAKARIGEARAQVASLVNASPAEIIFTGSASEANHLAILGALAVAPERRRIVTSAVEHPSTLRLVHHLRGQGVEVVELAVDHQGRIDPNELNAAITPATSLVTLMWANNETGALLPIAQAAALSRERGALFHCDAAQAAGRLAIDLRTLPIDLLSLSAHKLHGPKGVGALFVRKGLRWPPMVHGHQERGRRGGTENSAGIVGFGVAATLAKDSLHDDAKRMRLLRDCLERGLLAALPHVVVNAGENERLTNTSNFRVATTQAEVILDRLDRVGVCASGGSACTAGGTEPSHVLTAMGQSRGQALAALRFSLSRYTTAAEIDRVLAVVPAVVLPVLRNAA